MTKHELACAIEAHSLYEPNQEGVNSKNHYKYSSIYEVNHLMKMTKDELQDMYNMGYSADGRELDSSEIGW